MANKNLFKSQPGVVNTPTATVRNAAGGDAYQHTDKHALAQIAATNTFNGTYYSSAEETLKLAKDAVSRLDGDPEFIAKVAIFSRDKAYMKDMPAFLAAVLAARSDGEKPPHNNRKLFRAVFRKVVDNPRMLRTFIQIARSGAAGKILNMTSGAVHHAVQEWFEKKSPDAIFRASVGNDPSIQDILRMARPRPRKGSEKAALLAYLMTDLNNNTFDPKAETQDGNVFDKESRSFKQYRREKGQTEWRLAHEDPWDNLPAVVKQYEEFKRTKIGDVPNVDFRLLDSLGLGPAEWATIFRNGGWMFTRMNLNTAVRQGVFKHDPAMIQVIADRLRNKDEIVKARAFPYQLLSAYRAVSPAPRTTYSWMYDSTPASDVDANDFPPELRVALLDATDIATDNVPTFRGRVNVLCDVSGSMSSSITGNRGTASSKVRCVDVAGLISACVVRKNPTSRVVPFEHRVKPYTPNPRDSVLTIADQLAAMGGGGTDCGAAIAYLNEKGYDGDIVFVSDNESWISTGYGGRGTKMLNEWTKYKGRNPGARLVCIDLTPSSNSQVVEQPEILQIGGFSDTVWDVVANFLEHGRDAQHWVDVIEAIEIE